MKTNQPKKEQNWDKFINAKCPLCKMTHSYPVKFKALPCRCKNRYVYCMTCLRDAIGINTNMTNNPIKNCPTCNEEFHIEGLNARNTYYPISVLADLYDKKYGKIKCPRKCDWEGFRSELLDHGSKCLNGMRKCELCAKTFTLKSIDEHKMSCDLRDKNQIMNTLDL